VRIDLLGAGSARSGREPQHGPALSQDEIDISRINTCIAATRRMSS
jgi:hypothetical protein